MPLPSVSFCGRVSVLFVSLAGFLAGAVALQAVTLSAIEPQQQAVYSMVTLRGTDFGIYSLGISRIVFTSGDGSIVIDDARPYVWRDDFIQVRVPAGGPAGKIPLDDIDVTVETPGGTSNALPFQVLARPSTGSLRFSQRSKIVANEEVSGFLGAVSENKARTKDAHFGDVNGDGYPDLIDSNSNNSNNGTHSVLRQNMSGAAFFDTQWEPLDTGDTGDFAVTILPDGLFPGNVIVYDADFIDLNNDELPEWVTGDAGSALRVRVDTNNYQGVPGRFVEDTATWLPSQSAPGSPDDVCSTDVNFDGFVDIAVSYRFSRSVDVFYNDNGQSFGVSRRLDAVGTASIHDVFFIDANDDGFADVIAVNESAGSQLFLSDGNLPNPSFIHDQTFADDGHSGIAADFNGDGVEDFALSEFNKAIVYLNDPATPGNFMTFALPDAVDFTYDLEAGDVDLDGDIDLIGAVVTLSDIGDNASRVWINGGDGQSWTTWSDASDILPGIGDYERLSADLVDFDLDGDLDLYLTGSDGSGPWGFGASPNQFWENKTTGMRLGVTGHCPGSGTINVSSATAGATLTIFGSTTPGSVTVPGGPCPGVTLDLASPQKLGLVSVDGSGVVNLPVDLPPAACDFFLQAVETDCGLGCPVSNRVAIPGADAVSGASNAVELPGVTTRSSPSRFALDWSAGSSLGPSPRVPNAARVNEWGGFVVGAGPALIAAPTRTLYPGAWGGFSPIYLRLRVSVSPFAWATVTFTQASGPGTLFTGSIVARRGTPDSCFAGGIPVQDAACTVINPTLPGGLYTVTGVVATASGTETLTVAEVMVDNGFCSVP